MAFNYKQGNWIAFDPDTKKTITSKQILDDLLKNNYKFEACISQTAVIDSLVFAIVFAKCDECRIQLDTKKRKEINKLALGAIIDFLEKNSLLDSFLLQKLKDYNKERIVLVHHTIKGKIIVDFRKFYELGEKIVDELNAIIQATLTRKGIKHHW